MLLAQALEFAQLALLEGVTKRLPTATVVLVNDGDHSFKTRKKISGKSESEVMDGLADDVARWALEVSSLKGRAP